MSLFDWLMPKLRVHKRTVEHAAAQTAAARQPASSHVISPEADLKTQRQGRREKLYAVVREAMLRSEVLASRYKFKVLSLDTHGRQFLVMVDLLDSRAVAPARFSTIEQLIMSHAAQQHTLHVKSVYWRVNETPTAVQPVQPLPTTPVPAPTVVPVTPPVVPARVPPVATVHKPEFDPIDQAEVLAFKKAIGVLPNTPGEVAAGQARTSVPRQSGGMTGYEDTQLLDPPDDAASPLSRTQFGEL